MAIFNSKLLVYQRVNWLTWPTVLESLPCGNQTWQRNIQQSTPRFDDLPSERNLDRGFPIAIFDHGRVYPIIIPTYPINIPLMSHSFAIDTL